MNALNLDPFGSYNCKLAVLACFVRSFIRGENIKNKDSIRTVKVNEYNNEIHVLHKLKGLE